METPRDKYFKAAHQEMVSAVNFIDANKGFCCEEAKSAYISGYTEAYTEAWYKMLSNRNRSVMCETDKRD